ncbi:hypothetical protein T11_15894 [Trichinella zimbabwensis]|uniref:Uncharacterized protein n=1 Tax=Trichinella zimbabwensis TaxID=268475 RepID=A0A0V1HT48_9BILA|nr:hypothetical protein T11_15894 [Trichinella zimbabwensis]
MASYSGIEQKPWLMNFSKWLQCRLEDFGFDAYIYTRYILSVLRQPVIQMDPYDDDIEMVKGKFSSKNLKKSIWHCSPGDCTSAADDPFKATLFECLMDDGLDIDIVENLVDDIVEKYRQMNSFEATCEKEDNVSLKPAKCISCIISYDEAFPPLAASTAVMLKNRILSSANKRVADFCFQNGEHSPADLIVVSSATSTVLGPGTYPKRAKMLSAVYDGKVTQLGPSDLQQAYDNVMEIAFKEWCDRIGVPSVTTIGTGMYAGVRPYFLSSSARTETYWDMYRPLQREPVVSSLQYQQPQLLQRYETTSSSNSSSLLPPRSVSQHYECEFEETFSDHVIRAIDNLLDDEEEDNLPSTSSAGCALKLQSVVTVPIRPETHFIPISLLSSPEERHYPVEELATRNGSLAPTVGEGQFFVFRDNSTTREIGSNSFRVKFRVTKVDKACQTDDWVDLPRVCLPTSSSSAPSPVVWLSRFGQLEFTPSMTSAFKPWRKLDNKLSWPRIRLNPQHCWAMPSTEATVGACSGNIAVVGSGRNPSDLQDDDFELLRLIRPERVSPDPPWIFQDEEEEDLLIRYVSSISLIAPLCPPSSANAQECVTCTCCQLISNGIAGLDDIMPEPI